MTETQTTPTPVPSWEKVRVYGTWRAYDGSLRPGTYRVTYPRVVNRTDDAIISAGVYVEGALNTQSGLGVRSLDLMLPTTDDPDNLQAGFKVVLEVVPEGAARETYSLDIPTGSPGIDLAMLVPSFSQVSAPSASLKLGMRGGVALLNADGDVVDADGGVVSALPDQAGQAGRVLTTDGAEAAWTTAPSGDWAGLTGKPAVIAAGSSMTAARDAIGAGTSNLQLGVGSTTAKSGDWHEDWATLTGKPATFAPTIGTTSTTALAGNTAYVPPTRTVAGKALSADVTLAKADVGLGAVDNTSDAAKPVSVATQAALEAKAPVAALAGFLAAVEQASDGTWPSRPTSPVAPTVVLWLRYPGRTETPTGYSAGHDLLVSKA